MKQANQTLGVCLLVAVMLAPSTHGQTKAPRAKQYKRVHQDALTKILQGEDANAIKILTDFIGQWPDDSESWYMLAVGHAHAGRDEQAIAAAKTAIELGLPAERFVSGSKTLLDPLADSAFIVDLRRRFAHAPLHGPMLGDVTDVAASIWVRTVRGATVRAIVGIDSELSSPVASEAVTVTATSDSTAVLRVKGLKPATEYWYRLEIDGQRSAGGPFRLKTFPPQYQPAKFRFVFGGGAGYVPFHERMWDTIGAAKPDFLLLLGDNVYSDDPETPQMQHYCYYRRQSRPEFRKLVRTTPVFSIWDDHDFGKNDCVEGPLIDEPAWKMPVYRVFRNNWVNPSYGGGDSQPGCYYDFYVGDVHFIMLDGRFYRTLVPSQGGPTMLGPVQRQWLKTTIDESRGQMIVICSPVPWVFQAKGDSKDTWNGFRSERNEILDHLANRQKHNVILVSADRHRSDLWKIERPNDSPIYEFNSSRLTNQHVHRTMAEAEFSYNEKQSFGVIEVDTTSSGPSVHYRIMTIDGEEVFHRQISLAR